MAFRTITFEMSLKPFRDASAATRVEVCRHVFTQWLALTRHADSLAVLLWAADGSEILDYRGVAEDTFEWAYWQGVANPRRPYSGSCPEAASIHERPRRYLDSPAVFTYGWLAELVATICLGDTMGRGSMVCCYARLHGDHRAYAGFPEGIPEGTRFGTFLGRQAQHFLDDLGFDYLWLSNGFGFGLETWGLRGAVFDGSRFSADRCEEVRDKSLGFWESFREECPDYPLQTRGTNLSTGMDLSSDAVPLRDIYRRVEHLLPPPNSPWAALNGDFGLELVGWMSHIAEIPGDRYLFRFYTHDPWFLNSPWLDRYRREPHDIYLPLTVSRIDENGRTQCPTDLAFLSVDDSWGRMPDQVPNEVIPHILWARSQAPDAPGPFVWVYPFDEYHERTFGSDQRLGEVFFGDWFMRGAVNQGLPLNTVVSCRHAGNLLARDPERLGDSILVTPVPDRGTAWSERLGEWVNSGGELLLYGPLARAPQWLLECLDVELAEALEGEFTLEPFRFPDSCGYGTTIRHHALLSAGGVAAAPGGGDVCEQLIQRQGDVRRLAASCSTGGGRVVWIRGSVSCDPTRLGGHLLVPETDPAVFPGEALMRWGCARFGWEFRQRKEHSHAAGPLICISRHSNGFIFAGHQEDSTVSSGLRSPFGVPLLTDTETRFSEPVGWYQMPHAWLRECRLFVDQGSGGILRCRTRRSAFPGIRRRIEVTGLDRARVVFFPEPGFEKRTIMTSNASVPCVGAEPLPTALVNTASGSYLTAAGVSGQIVVSW